MSRYRRMRLEGGVFFFTVVTFERRPILTTDAGVRCLRHAWMETQRTHPFNSEAFCILPDHIHAVWSLPEDDSDYSVRWRKLKGLFSRRYRQETGIGGSKVPSRIRRREVDLWQRRFWEHRIRDVDDFRRHVDYSHFNPVKHGYVTSPADWRLSSFMDHVSEGWVEPDWGTIEPEELRNLDAGE